MIEIRIHGRGGQGVVTAAELIAIAAFYDGQQAQAFPNFGVERRGAPIQSYARLSQEKILTRSQIYFPDYVIVEDATLLGSVPVFSGLKKGGKVVINSHRSFAELKEFFPRFLKPEDVLIQDVTKIALDILGKPIVNTIILGSFARFSGLVSLPSLKKALRDKFQNKPEILAKNLKAISLAYKK